MRFGRREALRRVGDRRSGVDPLSAGSWYGGSGAFTLLELLLALAVFAIVLTAINGVFFATLRLRNKTSDAFDRALPIEQAVTMIRRDLAGLMLPGGVLSGTFRTTPTTSGSLMETVGRRVSPDLYTSTGMVDEGSPYSEVQKVGYFLVNPTNQSPGFELVRASSRNLLPAATEEIEPQLLLSGVESATMTFYNGYDWTEVWDGAVNTNLPSAVRVRILMMPDEERTARRSPIEVVVPVLVQSAAAETAQSGGGTP